MRAENEARTQLDELGADIRQTLQNERVAYVRWEPGNGTGYELLIVPWEATVEHANETRPMYESQGQPGWVYVSRFTSSRRSTYPFRFWELDGTPVLPHARGIGDALAEGSYQDGCALHLLFAAIVGEAPMCSWADAGSWWPEP